jgi:hypothetical protein
VNLFQKSELRVASSKRRTVKEICVDGTGKYAASKSKSLSKKIGCLTDSSLPYLITQKFEL